LITTNYYYIAKQLSKPTMKNVAIGDLLSPEQREMLTPNARELDHDQLSNLQSDKTLGGNLSREDHASIVKLALHRANNGQTVLTYSHMNFDTDDEGNGNGRTNW